MASRRLSSEHQQAVARRLAQLGAELEAVRADDTSSIDDTVERPAADGTEWWSDHTRVISERPLLRVVTPVPSPMPPAAVPPVPLAVPVPGRHASRRSRGWSTSVWADAWRDRVRFGAGQLAAVAVLLAVGLGITTWWVVRGDPSSTAESALPPVTATPLVSVAPVPGGASTTPVVLASPAQPAAGTGTVTVDVAGRVRRPGIAVLHAGARVFQAIRAAGGADRGVDLTNVNLARVLVDGEQIVVGQPSPTGAAAAAAVPSAGATDPLPATLVDLNTATAADLDSLPEVGPVTAQSILTWRDQHGGFTSVDELLEVDGIGDATLTRIAPYVTV